MFLLLSLVALLYLGSPPALGRSQLYISVGLNVELNHATWWATKEQFPVAPPSCLNPHGSPGLNHITWAKAWRQNIASEAASVVRAGLCEHVIYGGGRLD